MPVTQHQEGPHMIEQAYALIAAKMFAKAAEQPKKIERIAKGLALVMLGHVSLAAPTQNGTTQWLVASQDYENLYRVTHNDTGSQWVCTCKDHQHNGLACCKHIAAAYITYKATKHYTHTTDDGATVLLGNQAIADAQAAEDARVPAWKRACDTQHERGR